MIRVPKPPNVYQKRECRKAVRWRRYAEAHRNDMHFAWPRSEHANADRPKPDKRRNSNKLNWPLCYDGSAKSSMRPRREDWRDRVCCLEQDQDGRHQQPQGDTDGRGDQ